MIHRFTEDNFHSICDELAIRDLTIRAILDQYSYPPFWVRPNTFETLVLTILEQQVSLASAYAAYKRLKEQLDPVVPDLFLQLDDDTLRSCYFSRQKITYTRILAQNLVDGTIDLRAVYLLPDDEVRKQLKSLKGIGDWTVDIYLIHALQRADIFPIGDLALLNGIRMAKEWPLASKEELLKLSFQWQPYRSMATMIFWHYYIKKKNIRLLH